MPKGLGIIIGPPVRWEVGKGSEIMNQSVNYAVNQPYVVTWEVTRACQLHCRHCRAQAITRRDPQELRLREFYPVLDDLVTHFSAPPILVFTGGDPIEREDLDQILSAAIQRNIRTAVAPSVTPRLTNDTIKRWRDLGVHAVSLSIDGPTAAVHDRYRGVPGVFDRSLRLAERITREGLSLQINTSVSRQTVHHLSQMGQLVRFLGVSSWEVFFVIPTGRASIADCLDPSEMEGALVWLAQWSNTVPFRVTAVGAPQYHRVMAERFPADRQALAVREARGFAFIDHQGYVYPSGYLPISAGNVRSQRFSTIYRESELFTRLRDSTRLDGRCGMCEWSERCGGSRARAYAVTGNYLAADPGCLGVSV